VQYYKAGIWSHDFFLIGIFANEIIFFAAVWSCAMVSEDRNRGGETNSAPVVILRLSSVQQPAALTGVPVGLRVFYVTPTPA
jgi:hypothetical protein